MKLLEKESDIQRTICDYLALKKHFFWRQNTTPVFDPTKKSFRRMPKYSMKGVPDIIVLWKSFPVFLEVKAKGKVQSPEQKEFQAKCEKQGIEYYVVRKLSEVQEIGL